jgi:hypothetical protein
MRSVIVPAIQPRERRAHRLTGPQAYLRTTGSKRAAAPHVGNRRAISISQAQGQQPATSGHRRQSDSPFVLRERRMTAAHIDRMARVVARHIAAACALA